MIELSKIEQPKIEEDVVGGGGFIWPTDVYDCTVKMAFYFESDGGAAAIHLNLEDNKTGKEVKQDIYFTNKKRETFYVKNGAKHDLPGFLQVANLCAVIDKATLPDTLKAHEIKTIMVYDYKERKEVPQDKEVLVTLLGKKLQIAVKHVVENKSIKNETTGKWEAVAGTKKERNELSTPFFSDTSLTAHEMMNKETEPKFKKAWLDKWKGEVIDKRKLKNDAPAETKTGSTEPKPSLFD